MDANSVLIVREATGYGPVVIGALITGAFILVAAIIAYKGGLHTYFKKREHELIMKRYLDDGVDLLAANVEHGLGVFKKNYIRALRSLRLFRDTQASGLDLDPKAYSEEFKKYDPEAFYVVPLCKLQRLIGEDVEIFDKAIQELFSFLDKTTMFFEDDMCTAIRECVEGNKETAPAEKIADFYMGKTKQFSDEFTKYYSIIRGLRDIVWILETSVSSFKELKEFKDKPEIKGCVKRLKDEFAKDLKPFQKQKEEEKEPQSEQKQ